MGGQLRPSVHTGTLLVLAGLRGAMERHGTGWTAPDM